MAKTNASLLKLYGRRIRRLTKPGREADDLARSLVHGHLPAGFTGLPDDNVTSEENVEKGKESEVEVEHLESMSTDLAHLDNYRRSLERQSLDRERSLTSVRSRGEV